MWKIIEEVYSHWARTKCCCSAAQTCPALCDPMDGSPGTPLLYWDFPGRILEWDAISSSGNFPSRDLILHLLHWQEFFTTETPGSRTKWGDLYEEFFTLKISFQNIYITNKWKLGALAVTSHHISNQNLVFWSHSTESNFDEIMWYIK